MASQEILDGGKASRGSFINDPKVRGIFFQLIVVVLLVAGSWWIVNNVVDNLRRSNIASGFGFLNSRAGFDIAESPIAYSSDSTYGRALLVGFLNTLIVAGAGIATATVIGFVVGIGRLSHNWLIRKICTVYIEVFRNIPPLLVIFFWYFGVLSVLPGARDSIHLPLESFLNNRGFYFPRPVWGEGSGLILLALAIGVVLAFFVARRARQRQMATGQTFPVFRTALALVVGIEDGQAAEPAIHGQIAARGRIARKRLDQGGIGGGGAQAAGDGEKRRQRWASARIGPAKPIICCRKPA